MNRKVRILFLTSGDRVPSTRFRILPFLPHFRSAGLDCTVAASFPQKYDYFPWLGFRPSQFLKRMVRRWHLLRARLRPYDVVVIDRELFDNNTWEMEERFRRVARHMVLELDDAIFLRNPEKVERLVRMSDLVVAGNPQIEDWIRPFGAASVIVPTGVELAQFPLKEETSCSSRPIVGWMGTTSNLEYFKVVAPALRRLAQRCDFEMRFIVPELRLPPDVDLEGVPTKHIVWRGATEVEELRKIDIGVMPLFADREWDKYKCPTKMIQYMAIGIPGVASPRGFTADVVEHGKNGFLADSSEEWEEILFRLINNPALRREIGAAGRAAVASKYCVEANWRLLADAYRQLADSPPTFSRGLN